MGTITYELGNELSNVRTLEQLKIMQESNSESFIYPDAIEYLVILSEQKGISKKDLIRKIVQQTHLERAFVYHLMNGTKRMTRDKFLMFSIAGNLSVEETNTLLKYAGEAELYSRNPRDAVLIFILNNSINLVEANICLAELNVETLK